MEEVICRKAKSKS